MATLQIRARFDVEFEAEEHGDEDTMDKADEQDLEFMNAACAYVAELLESKLLSIQLYVGNGHKRSFTRISDMRVDWE